MQQYLFQCQTSTGMPPWEYKTEFASDDMAKGYGERVTRLFQGTPWFFGLIVWRNGELLAHYKLGEPPVISRASTRRHPTS